MVHFLEVNDPDFYKEGIRLLHDCWTKSVNVGGDSVENKLARFSEIDSFYLRPWIYQSPLVFTISVSYGIGTIRTRINLVIFSEVKLVSTNPTKRPKPTMTTSYSLSIVFMCI